MTALTAVASGQVTSGSSKTCAIVLPERFDVHEVPQFASNLDPIATTGSVVVIDASEVRYIDRRGMDALIDARLRCMDHGGDLTLADASVAARVILELSGCYEALNPIETAVRQDLPLESEQAA